MLGVKKKNKKQTVRTFFDEQWKEEELIGEGSYGKVYKAKKEEFGISTYSAIKQIEIPQSKAEIQTLKTEGMTHQDIISYYENSVQKWADEIKFMSIFKDSENIVNIEDYEIIKRKNEIGWIVNIRMELLENVDNYVLENNITDKEMLKMAIDIATALQDCEANNIIHRDVKPDNIFVNKKGIYKLGDFGIAKHIEKTVSNMSKKGTENYMAPELYKNEKGNKTVDTYSLGIMLYRYFNYNRLPFLPDYPEKITLEAREEALYKRISGEKIRAPQNATREIAEIILKACSYYPKDRYSSATELKEDLEKEYNKIERPRVLFDYNDKKMQKIFTENSKSDTHDETISIMTGMNETAKGLKEEINIQAQIIQEDKNTEQGSTIEKTENSTETQSIANEENDIVVKENKVEEVKKEVKKNKKEAKIKVKDKEKAPKSENKIKSEATVKLKRHKKLIIIPIIIILLAIIIVFVAIKLRPQEPEIVQYSMISVVGMESEVATEELQKIKCEVEYEYVETENEEEIGKVLEQSIPENELVNEGTVVTLKVAVSVKKVEVIKVIGKTREEAQKELEELGLLVTFTEQNNEKVEKDIVISQMPEEGEKVNVGSTVEILVSLGKKENDNSEAKTDEEIDRETNNSKTSNESNKNTQWSDWMEKLPSGINSNEYQIEEKTQYSSRTKQTTTSEKSSLSGWIKEGEHYQYKTYEEVLSSPAQDTSTKEYTQTGTVRGYTYNHCCAKINGVWYVAGTYDKFPNNESASSYRSTISLFKKTTPATANTVTDEPLYSIGSKCSSCGYDAWGYNGEYLRYEYTVKEKITIYDYYKWSDWSSYSDKKVTEDSNTEVRTRTLYRYK